MVRHLRASKGCRPQLLRLLLTYRFVTTSLAASVLCATLAQAEEREKNPLQSLNSVQGLNCRLFTASLVLVRTSPWNSRLSKVG